VEWEAAVSLVLRARADLELLLIKRAESHGDPWSGHMALPGGRKDPQDESLLHTAVRETLEETGVSLGATRHLGQLTRVDPATRRLPRLAVTPHVFGVPADTEAHVASHEVASVLWVPLSTLRDPAVADTYRHDAGALIRLFPSFNVAGEVVWGLTYRVLEEFLRLAP
jgi:8-oxo-dGTP pyrophosphatase MutT (NUDIX family)